MEEGGEVPVGTYMIETSSRKFAGFKVGSEKILEVRKIR
jgi:hypothetical protein